jgi:uncharacterized protein DUF1236
LQRNKIGVNELGLRTFVRWGKFPFCDAEQQLMASRIRAPSLVILVFLLATAARAQNPSPDEAVKPDGSVRQELTLTAGQRSAIYNAVVQQRLHASGTGIPAAVGAPVPWSVELSDLPEQAATADVWNKSSAADLKYAMVDDDVVVVDPIKMQVIDIIRGGRP